MGINNKQELLDRLADDMFQGFSSQGEEMMFSIFETDDYSRMSEINRSINGPISFLMSQPMFSCTPIQFLQMCLKEIELETPEEVAQFLWHAGYMFGILTGTIDTMNNLRKGDQL